MIESASDRFVAQTLLRLHRQSGGAADAEAAVTQAATRLWQAMKAGDVCVALDGFDDQTMVANLLASPIVGRESASGQPGPLRPLVVSGNFLYTNRYWQAEATLARKLVARAAPDTTPEVDATAPDLPPSASDRQRQAIQRALAGRLLILTGGPGTGKTFTLAAIVQAILAHPGTARAGAAPVPTQTGTGAVAAPLAVAIAAPTGKATARLADAILPAIAGRADVSLEAVTLHRLLGMTGRVMSDRAERRLPFDLVVIDECSMVDTLMAHRLIESLPTGARLVLAGDRDQLASVQAGAFFSALTTSDVPVLQSCRVVLDQNFRQREAPQIVDWADAVRDGRLAADALPDHGAQVQFDDAGMTAMVERMVARLGPMVRQAGECAMTDIAGLHAQFLAEQALAMLRTGPQGVDAINDAVSRRLRLISGFGIEERWYPGRLVVVRRNATHRGLFNGDIGLCVALPDQEGGAQPVLRVAFTDGSDAIRLVLTSQMPDHVDAWALTVHQAQGSDFDSVLLMPAPLAHPLATREGLYTALTRARRSLRIYGTPQMMVAAAACPAERVTGLPEAFRAARYT